LLEAFRAAFEDVGRDGLSRRFRSKALNRAGSTPRYVMEDDACC